MIFWKLTAFEPSHPTSHGNLERARRLRTTLVGGTRTPQAVMRYTTPIYTVCAAMVRAPPNLTFTVPSAGPAVASHWTPASNNNGTRITIDNNGVDNNSNHNNITIDQNNIAGGGTGATAHLTSTWAPSVSLRSDGSLARRGGPFARLRPKSAKVQGVVRERAYAAGEGRQPPGRDNLKTLIVLCLVIM